MIRIYHIDANVIETSHKGSIFEKIDAQELFANKGLRKNLLKITIILGQEIVI